MLWISCAIARSHAPTGVVYMGENFAEVVDNLVDKVVEKLWKRFFMHNFPLVDKVGIV